MPRPILMDRMGVSSETDLLRTMRKAEGAFPDKLVEQAPGVDVPVVLPHLPGMNMTKQEYAIKLAWFRKLKGLSHDTMAERMEKKFGHLSTQPVSWHMILEGIEAGAIDAKDQGVAMVAYGLGMSVEDFVGQKAKTLRKMTIV